MSAAELLTERRGALGLITLNRPKALNALSLGMVRAMRQALLDWRDDPTVQVVLVHADSERAFCAGGDIRFFHEAARSGDPRLEDFFTEEYALNHLIHHYPKPYVAWMEGIVMGGGMGIAQGAARRLVTPASRLAMPETQIGLFPDVGAGWFLSRCPHRVGEFLGLTGAVMGSAEALRWGLADQCVQPAAKSPLIDAMTQGRVHDAPTLDAWVREANAQAQPLSLLPWADDETTLQQVFAQRDVPAIFHALRDASNLFAQETLALLLSRSPRLLCVTLEQIRRARHMPTLGEVLRMERDLMRHCLSGGQGEGCDAIEGIRARVIDKDHRPAWQPARLEDVSRQQVLACFDSPWPACAHPLRDLD